MNGKQLEQYIDMALDTLEEIDSKHPELRRNIEPKLGNLRLLDDVTAEARETAWDENLPANVETYAKRTLNNVLVGNEAEKFIDYSPLFYQLAKYDLKLSNMCNYIGISSSVRDDISKNISVQLKHLLPIAEFLECDITDLFTTIDSEEKSRRQIKTALVNGASKVDHKGVKITKAGVVVREIKNIESLDVAESRMAEGLAYDEFRSKISSKWTTGHIKSEKLSNSHSEELNDLLETIMKNYIAIKSQTNKNNKDE